MTSRLRSCYVTFSRIMVVKLKVIVDAFTKELCLQCKSAGIRKQPLGGKRYCAPVNINMC